ncbi:hypothetical protein PG987_007286 [Apiospora arundinis]
MGIPNFSSEVNLGMVRDIHVEGESQADYYLDVYADATSGSDDGSDDDTSRADLYYHSSVGHASELDDGNVSDASGAEPASSSSSPSPSNDPQIKWFKEVSQSWIWDPSPSSEHDGDDVNKDDYDLDDLFGPDPVLQVSPVDYSENRRHHLNRAAGPKNDPRHANPWLYAKWSKQQCLLPHTEALSNESASRVEAHRTLLGREPPRPPPTPRYRYYKYQPPSRWYNGAWWLPPTELHRVQMRPGSPPPPHETRSRRRRRTRSETPGDGDDDDDERGFWAEIPCACWHCRTHPWPEGRAALFDRRKVLGDNFVEYNLPR